MKFGAHVSIAGSISKAFSRAKSINCDTFQIFTRSPRQWKAKELSANVVESFRLEMENTKLYPIYSHMPYLPNLASPDNEIWNKSVDSLKLELNRCEMLDIPYIVTHLGSPKKSSREEGIEKITKAMNIAYKDFTGKCQLLLENTTGKSKLFGSSIEDICEIIAYSDYKKKIGLCFDTCHAFATGYDIRIEQVVTDILSEIDDCIGLDKLKIIHCNDSKFHLGSGRDRHEHLGLGEIGHQGFVNLLTNKKLRKVPFVCETPIDEQRDDKGNLDYLRTLLKEIKEKDK